MSESSCVRNETADIDILVRYKNGDTKLYKLLRIISGLPMRIRKWN